MGVKFLVDFLGGRRVIAGKERNVRSKSYALK